MRGPSASSLGLFLAVAAAGFSLAVLGTRFFGVTANPEGDIITQLKRAEREGLSLEVPGVAERLLAGVLHYDRTTVQVDYDRGTAVAVSTLDFTGKLGDTQVSSLGLEKIRFQYRDGSWEPAEPLAPLLIGIVHTLERRRAAVSAGDAQALAAVWGGAPGTFPGAQDPLLRGALQVQRRDYRAKAWYIRSERSEVTVTEDYRLTGSLPDRPVDETGSRRLSLILRDREFFFWPSLM